MSENDKQTVEDTVSTSETITAVDTEASASSEKKSPVAKYTIAVLVVVAIILGVLYQLEKEDRASTNIFGSILASQEDSKVVAVVNGTEIINSDLTTSIQQFSQAASVQGVDLTNPEAQTEIRKQALEVLINTELLRQTALEQGFSVTDEETDERIETIKTEIGGPEVLAERMASLGITDEQLHEDVKDEILIQRLLDKIFLEADVVVTEEEIVAVYDNAGGEEAGLPVLEEVKAQIEEQIKASKEQVAIDGYINNLKQEAEIEIKLDEAEETNLE